jgi:flagellar hook-length control protein FliK
MAIALALGGGRNGRIAVSLDPVELGRVEITVERMHDTAVVQVSAERPETLALLARDGATLDRALGGAGIGSEGGRSLSFSLLGEGSGQGAGQGSGQGTEGGSHRGHHGRHGRHGPQGMPLDDTAPQRRALLGLLDVAI